MIPNDMSKHMERIATPVPSKAIAKNAMFKPLPSSDLLGFTESPSVSMDKHELLKIGEKRIYQHRC